MTNKENELREALLDMVWQFCSNGEVLSHSFMSAEEHAFGVLGLENGMTYEQAEETSKKSITPKIKIFWREAFEATYSSGDVISDAMSLARRGDGEYEQSLARLCFKWFCRGRACSASDLTMLDSSEMVERVAFAICETGGYNPEIAHDDNGQIKQNWEDWIDEAKAALGVIKKALGGCDDTVSRND